VQPVASRYILLSYPGTLHNNRGIKTDPATFQTVSECKISSLLFRSCHKNIATRTAAFSCTKVTVESYIICDISDFRLCVGEVFVLLVCYAACVGDWLPTFRDNHYENTGCYWTA
jgi:hypothetical protein